jgi:hypothetical protein
MVDKVIIVAETRRRNSECADEETWPFGPAPLRPVFDLVAARHGCGGLVPTEFTGISIRVPDARAA